MLVMDPPTTLHTPEDLLNPPDSKLYELIDGQLVEKPVSVKSIWVATNLACELQMIVKPAGLGWVLVEQPVVCFPWNPNHGRRPDVCFISKVKLPGPDLPDGNLLIAPDLVAEVVSPTENVFELDSTIEDYRRVGVRVVWVINSQIRTVRVHAIDGSIKLFRHTDTLTADDVIPGFSVKVAALFPPVIETPPLAPVAIPQVKQ